MDVLVLIDKLDDLVHNARAVPLTDQVRVDKEEIYDILDQMRATIPEEIKQARWIVKERQEMLAEAKREAERIVKEARERQERMVSEEEITKQAERGAEDIIEDARAREREIRLGAEDYADEILNTLEVNLSKFIAAVRRGRDAWRARKSPPKSASRFAVSPARRPGCIRTLALELTNMRLNRQSSRLDARAADRARGGHPGRAGDRVARPGAAPRSTCTGSPPTRETPDPRDYDLVVTLGSEARRSTTRSPWLARERRLLRAAADADVPVLGICFGEPAARARPRWRGPARGAVGRSRGSRSTPATAR